MCGIYGYIQNTTKKKPLETCLKGLRKLQYRGYDSAGVASVENGSLISYKAVGKVDLLDVLIQKTSHELSFGIAHTRWATHGSLDKRNAHPQFDTENTLALVHNGIIENYIQLKNFLEEAGVIFTSETDTEVIVKLISYYYDNNLKNAVAKALSRLEGSFSIALIDKNSPNMILAAARNCPLAIGICNSTKDVYISSDPYSFSSSTYKIFFLVNDEIAKLTSSSLLIYDKKGQTTNKSSSSIVINHSVDDKKGYDHYMHKEIHEQSLLSREILLKRIHNEGVFYSELEDQKYLIKRTQNIEIIACGSSYHAGLITKEYLEKTIALPVSVHYASEYRYSYQIYKPNSIGIFISQSGETADTLAALRYRKDYFNLTIALCNVENSTLTRECDKFIPLYVGREISVCSTKAFTSQLLNLYLLGVHISNIFGRKTDEYIREFKTIPYAIDDILGKEEEIKFYSEIYSKFPYFFYTGRGIMYPTCMEAALKLKEISYIPAEALPSGEMKHGPIALIDQSMATVAFLGDGITSAKTLSNLNEIKARNGNILIFGSERQPSISNDSIVIHQGEKKHFSSIIYSIAGQLFAYYVAKSLNREIDLPRNLAKSVTVE